MKKLVYLFLMLSFIVQGQEANTPHRFVLGGSLSGVSNTVIAPETRIMTPTFDIINPGSSNSNHSFNLSPYFAWQLNPRSLFGLRLNTGFGLSRQKTDGIQEPTFKSNSFTYGLGLFYRYYINPANRLRVFVSPSVNGFITNGTVEQRAPSLEENRSINFSTGISLGATFSITEKWNLLVNIWGVGFNHSNFRTASDPESRITNSINASFSLSRINFGAEYSF